MRRLEGFKMSELKKKQRKTILKCPECNSLKINQYRMPVGKIWCTDCNYFVSHKERFNPFISEDLSDEQ